MKKAVFAATAAALIAGSAVSYAANPQTGNPGPQRWQPTAEDRAILTDARLAALKTGLKLNAEQEKLWPALETTLRDVSKERAARAEARRAERQAARQPGAAAERPDPITRMRAAASGMDARAADLRKIADAAEPLYKTLDEAQKQRLNVLIRQNMRGMTGGPGRFHPEHRRG